MLARIVALVAGFFGSTAPVGRSSLADFFKAVAVGLAPLVPTVLGALFPAVAAALPVLGLPPVVLGAVLAALKLLQSRLVGPAK